MAMYRGLLTFISDVRNCKTKEQEQQRVDKELANVRAAFTSGKMTAYDRKKYVWKLVYINMLGYDVNFGHMEMIALVSSASYAEKLVGYLSVSVMLKNTDEQITLVVQSIKKDLQSTSDPVQCLALAAIANIGGKELAETVASDVQRILFSRSIFPVVRKKAALCLLRLVRISKELMPAEEWSKKIISLLEDKNLGVVLSVVTLITGLAERDPGSYEAVTGHLLVWLTKLVVHRSVSEDYIYHNTPCPWLQVKILRLLQYFPIPATEAMRTRLKEILITIMNKTEVTKSVNRNNAEHCVLFEAVNLIIKQGDASDETVRAKAVAHLSRFINIREPNIRYLGLETMARMASMEGTGDAIRKQKNTIMFSLKDADISIRRRALDLLFAMCDTSIAEELLKELLQYLAVADYAIKDEMVLKMAILAERFSPNPRWYVDTIIQLINIAGDFVSDDIWHRVVQIVTNNEELQKYAASKLYHALEPPSAHETAVKVGAYILGEFGFMLNDGDIDEGAAISGTEQFAVLHQHFPKCSTVTKAILLSSYAKMQNLYPEIRAQVLPIFEAHTSVIDAELQQRAVEYLHLPEQNEELLTAVLDAMPAFPERSSMLEARLKKAKEEATDKDIWEKEEKSGEGEEEGAEGASPRGRAATGEAAAGGAAAGAEEGEGAAEDGGAVGDLLGGFDAPAPAPAAVDPTSVPVTVRIGLDAAMVEKVPQLFNAILLKPSGLLYEDAYVQIGCKSRFTGAEGKLAVFLGNKMKVPMSGFKLRVPDHPGVKAVVEGDIPTTVPAGAQQIVTVSVECMAPFLEAPPLLISFIGQPGTGHAYPLRLPVAMHNFTEGIALPGADFRSRWTALSGPKEATAIFSPASGAAAVTMAAAQEGLAKLQLTPVDAGAPGPTSAGSFRTHALNPAGQQISVGCLAMVIPDASAGVFKVALRTQHGDVSKGMLTVLQNYLSAL